MLSGEYIERCRTNQNSNFFFCYSFRMQSYVVIEGNSSSFDDRWVLSDPKSCRCWTYICAFVVSMRFKNSKLIETNPLPEQYYFSSMAFRFWWFILVNLSPFMLNIVICNPFSLTHLRNCWLFCHQIQLVALDKQSALFFLLRAYQSRRHVLLIFPIFPSAYGRLQWV